MKATVARTLSEKPEMDVDRIFVNMDVGTKYSSKHWKTVASVSTCMVACAVLRAADDVARQLKSPAAVVLKCPPERLRMEDGKAYLFSGPSVSLTFKGLAHGYQYPGGNDAEGQVLGRGSFIVSDLGVLGRETGKGGAGPYWTVGAQAVEIEFDRREFTCRSRFAAPGRPLSAMASFFSGRFFCRGSPAT